MAASRASSTPRDLQFLDQIGGAGEEDAPAILDEAEANCSGQMGFATAGRAEQDQVGASSNCLRRQAP